MKNSKSNSGRRSKDENSRGKSSSDIQSRDSGKRRISDSAGSPDMKKSTYRDKGSPGSRPGHNS